MRNYVDRMAAGNSEQDTPEDFNQEELTRGVSYELTHTNDRDIAKEIAMRNLRKDPEHYKKLFRINKLGQLKESWNRLIKK